MNAAPQDEMSTSALTSRILAMNLAAIFTTSIVRDEFFDAVLVMRIQFMPLIYCDVMLHSRALGLDADAVLYCC